MWPHAITYTHYIMIDLIHVQYIILKYTYIHVCICVHVHVHVNILRTKI
jgi:hypothetical protein